MCDVLFPFNLSYTHLSCLFLKKSQFSGPTSPDVILVSAAHCNYVCKESVLSYHRVKSNHKTIISGRVKLEQVRGVLLQKAQSPGILSQCESPSEDREYIKLEPF